MVKPSKEEFMKCIFDLMREALDALSTIEKWAKHPEFLDYAEVLFDWKHDVQIAWQNVHRLAQGKKKK